MEELLDNQPKKMCVFCHAQVAMGAEICPFCRANFNQMPSSDEPKEEKKVVPGLSEKQTLDSLYPPPYQPKMEKIEEDEPKSFSEEIVEEKEVSTEKSYLLPIFLFSLGSQLLIFSVFLFFFSNEGMLFLRWKASLWYLYFVLSLGFLYGGYHLFSKAESEKP